MLVALISLHSHITIVRRSTHWAFIHMLKARPTAGEVSACRVYYEHKIKVRILVKAAVRYNCSLHVTDDR